MEGINNENIQNLLTKLYNNMTYTEFGWVGIMYIRVSYVENGYVRYIHISTACRLTTTSMITYIKYKRQKETIKSNTIITKRSNENNKRYKSKIDLL